MNLIKQIALHLEFLGFGTVDSTIFWGTVPDEPNDCIGVFSNDSGYAGSHDGARVQVIVRACTTKVAYETSQEIADAIIGFDGYLAGDGAHATIDAINTSAGLGADGKKRELYSSNYLVRYCEY